MKAKPPSKQPTLWHRVSFFSDGKHNRVGLHLSNPGIDVCMACFTVFLNLVPNVIVHIGHVNKILAGMVSGIVLGKSCQLPQIASKVPGEVHPDRRVKQMSRWVQNE